MTTHINPITPVDIVLSVITVNYNGLRDTCELIDSITFSDDMEMIVVDNGSRSDDAAVLEQRYPRVRVVRSRENLGFAGGNNLGIREARGKYLFLLNNDTLLTLPGEGGGEAAPLSGMVEAIFARHSSSCPAAAIVCPKIRFARGDRPIQYAGYTPLSSITLRNRAIGCGEADRGQYDVSHATPYAHGAAMLVSREAVAKAGLLPECYFLYYEELDWSLMFRRAGYAVVYDQSLTVCHKDSSTTGQGSPLRTYYTTRNRLLFAHRNVHGSRRFITYAYLICIVALRDIVAYAIRGKGSNVRAVLTGVAHFLKGRQGRCCDF